MDQKLKATLESIRIVLGMDVDSETKVEMLKVMLRTSPGKWDEFYEATKRMDKPLSEILNKDIDINQ